MEYRNPNDAFDKAISEGRLSSNKNHPRFAGDYMYMGTQNGTDMFKHIFTRQYIQEGN